MRPEVNKDDLPLINEHLSNERTFLAWLSTSVAVMAFGFVVVKFSLFADRFAPVLDMPPVACAECPAYLGVALVAAGCFGTLLAWWRYRTTHKKLREGKYVHATRFVTFVAAFAFCISALLVVFLALSATK